MSMSLIPQIPESHTAGVLPFGQPSSRAVARSTRRQVDVVLAEAEVTHARDQARAVLAAGALSNVAALVGLAEQCYEWCALLRGHRQGVRAGCCPGHRRLLSHRTAPSRRKGMAMSLIIYILAFIGAVALLMLLVALWLWWNEPGSSVQSAPRPQPPSPTPAERRTARQRDDIAHQAARLKLEQDAAALSAARQMLEVARLHQRR